MNRSTLSGLFLGLAAAVPLTAETGEPVARFEETTSVSWVLVPVSVDLGEGAEGEGVGLDREDFRLTVDERPVAFEDFISPLDNPQTLLFFQDLSGSMANGGKLEASRQIVRFFLEHARPADEVSITTFASGSTLVEVPITSRLDVVEEHVASWQAYGQTALHDAVTWIPEVRLAARSAPAVILVTDGIDNASVIPPERAREMVKKAEVPVYILALRRPGRGRLAASSRETLLYRDLLRRLAEVTGGRYVEALDAGEVDRACNIILQALRNRYSLGFRLAAGGEESYHSIRVTIPGRHVELRHRAGYTGSAPR